MTSGDPTLTLWAAACAEHALADFVAPPPLAAAVAGNAIAAARAWANGAGDLDACRASAFDAQREAGDAQDAGYGALAAAIRAASSAAASGDDERLALVAARYAREAVDLNSAGCERATRIGSERRWQWNRLDSDRRASVLGEEPPEPAASACAVDIERP